MSHQLFKRIKEVLFFFFRRTTKDENINAAGMAKGIEGVAQVQGLGINFSNNVRLKKAIREKVYLAWIENGGDEKKTGWIETLRGSSTNNTRSLDK